MARDHRSQIEAISDEVKVLHPLLERLLPKLPGVRRAEYTHGNTEMGADFVVTRLHDVMKTPQYIGVIAKVGRIAQDHADIDRQVEECLVARYAEGGKRMVRLDEIWVVSTGTASEGAKRKIHEKYKSTMVHFVDRDVLTDWIETYVSDYWSAIQPEVGEFLAVIRQAIAAADASTNLTVGGQESFYVPQEVHHLDSQKYSAKLTHKPKKPKAVDLTKEIITNRLILIEGEMGSGKSKLLRQTALKLADPEVHVEKKFIPILLSYRDFNDEFSRSIGKVLSAKYESALEAKHREGLRPLILIDALDEKMQDADEQIGVLQEIDGQLDAYTDVRVIVTGRHLSSVGETVVVGGSVIRYEIAPLSLSKLAHFLSLLCANLSSKDRLLEDIKRSQLFKSLPRSPIAAILLARILRESTQDLPSTLPELYAKYTELMLGRWDIEKGLQSQKEYDALDVLLMEVAEYLLENDLPGISEEELKVRFRAYLRDRNLDIQPDLLIAKLLDRSGIMSLDPTTHLVQFRHRSFAEFFYAKLAVKRARLPVSHRTISVYWANTYFFKFGILRDAEAEYRQFLGLLPRDENERWMKRLMTANLALAAYATPYDAVVEGLYAAVTDAAAHYLAIVAGEEESEFSGLSRMHVLWLFQMVVREFFGYNFFRKAFEEVALRIDASELPSADKAYSLFLLSVSAIEAGDKEGFGFLLDEHKAALPLDLSIAVSIEGKNIKDADSILRKQEKKLRRTLEVDRGFRAKVQNLFELPIKRQLPEKKKNH